MFKITQRTRIQEGASWEDIQDGDCYETGYEICDSDGEIIYDFADEDTKNWYEELNKKEEENTMTKQVNRQKDYEAYLDAVDVVCMGCAYNNETFCENCPVRKTVDKHEKKEKNTMNNNDKLTELACDIIDIFEELLDRLDITLPDKWREGEEDEARIFGDIYYELENKIIERLRKN